ncbi:10888_t:CDS:2 [Ambispora gerdemannii]|uniref:10888_t:CDS:1 n=1 Tax=Ambispora gerdemannii TaxID=144530 RepID=A0A9N9FAC2_9GLOM|nr:10888_t:CDS:2 [Ambispora gerdemannii]
MNNNPNEGQKRNIALLDFDDIPYEEFDYFPGSSINYLDSEVSLLSQHASA